MSVFAPRPSLSILVFLSALSALPMNMFVPSLPAIARDLDTTVALANLSIAGFAAASAILRLAAGTLSDRYGRRPVVLWSIAIFTLASVGCSLATDIHSFLAWRMVQGTVIAAYAVPLAAIRDTADERTTASRIGTISTAWAIAPMLGPTVGGLLDAGFGWRANFVAFAMLGALGFVLAVTRFAETNQHPSPSLVLHMRGSGDLVRSARFWSYSTCMAFSMGTLFTFLGAAPLAAKTLTDGSSVALGLYMGIVPAGYIAGSFLASRYGSRFDPGPTMIVARALTCLGLVAGLLFHAADVRHALAFFGPCAAIGLGNGLTMPAANAGVLSIRPALAGTASGLAGAAMVGGGALVAVLAGLVVTEARAPVAALGAMLALAVLAFGSAIVAAAVDRR